MNNDLDALTGRMMADLTARSHLLPPGLLADELAALGRPLGVRSAAIYLADLERRNLRLMRSSEKKPPAALLPIDSTLAGRAFQAVRIHHAAREGGLFRVWLPLVDGTERLGVLELGVSDVDDALLDRYRAVASIAALILVSKSAYSDTQAQVRRSRPMALQAEMVWAFMAPSTFATEDVLVTAALEPAYEIGGDAFDYSLVGDRMHVSIFDAVGHDLAAGLIASVAMASCRTARRAGGDLADIVANADHAIADQFGASRFATALLCDLDVSTGRLSWIPCGHPPPLLIRNHRVVKELDHRPWLPLGIADHPFVGTGTGEAAAPPVYAEQLQPGDRILLYTDGVVEGRAPDGRRFGLQRLGDFIIRHSATGVPAPETLRRLNGAVLDYQHGRLSDDATTVLLEWIPDNPGHYLTPRTGEIGF